METQSHWNPLTSSAYSSSPPIADIIIIHFSARKKYCIGCFHDILTTLHVTFLRKRARLLQHLTGHNDIHELPELIAIVLTVSACAGIPLNFETAFTTMHKSTLRIEHHQVIFLYRADMLLQFPLLGAKILRLCMLTFSGFVKIVEC